MLFSTVGDHSKILELSEKVEVSAGISVNLKCEMLKKELKVILAQVWCNLVCDKKKENIFLLP